jgi:hypothetical protein
MNVAAGFFVHRARRLPNRRAAWGERRIAETASGISQHLVPVDTTICWDRPGYPRKIPGITWDIPVGIYHKMFGFVGDLVAEIPRPGLPNNPDFGLLGWKMLGSQFFNIFTVLNLNEISKLL